MAGPQDLQKPFSDEEIAEIRTKLQQQNLLDANGRVVDVLTTFGDSQPVGAFAPIYDYISTLVADSPNVDQGTKYWFANAGFINSDNRAIAADNYIRGVTQYGLEVRGKVTGLSQAQIDGALQKTSNLIGQNVVQEILDSRGMPIFPIMISGDISGAIGQVSSAHVYLTYPFVLSWSMLEAMAAGCLVVGSRTPPVEEVIRDGENGLLVDFFSPKRIAERVDEVLAHPDRMHAFRESAMKTVKQRYDLKKSCLPAQVRLVDELVGTSSETSEHRPEITREALV
jgi:Glycosyl transferases group 1